MSVFGDGTLAQEIYDLLRSSQETKEKKITALLMNVADQKEIEESKARSHKIRHQKHIDDAVKARKSAIRNLKRANERLLELGVEGDK